jgi:secondary thiamine-phosphate synthase enzyme
MKQQQATFTVSTRGPGFTDVTQRVQRFVRDSGVENGVLTLFVPHTSASLLIQENADPDVQRDLTEFLRRIAPEDAAWITHRTEGADDMPAHIKSALTQTSLGIPVSEGELVLGTWQGLYLFEHRTAPHRRRILMHLVGD